MKKILFLFTLSILALTSCKKDDDSGNSDNEASIIGTWRWTSSSYNGEDEPLDECDLMDTFKFETNNKVTGTYHYDEDNDGSCESENEILNYTVDGSDLILSYPDDNSSFTIEIVSISNTTLILKDEEDSDVYISTYVKI